MATDRDILPGCFKPSHYDLAIQDLDLAKWTYSGVVDIHGELTEPTGQIVLNTLELAIQKARLAVHATDPDKAREEDVLEIHHNPKSQRSTLTFVKDGAQLFLPSTQARLVIHFTGVINHDLAGFYRSQYKPRADAGPAAPSTPRDADFHYMLSTQFESCDARRAFPCFDEPSLKATFAVALEIPDDLVALSNMPVRAERPAGPGRKRVEFATTPVMSTYLLAWAVGDFEYIEAWTDRLYDGRALPVRVYTTRGLSEQGRWALQHAPKYIDYFSDKFGIDYPLPKSDILAVAEFTHGAMENWGLVTYRSSAILFDEATSDTRFRNRIAYVVAHELAHQWFGNLVTMEWWDELWLNEGFATWAGWLATDHLHPDWDVWTQFVNEGMGKALKLDALRASHPIHVTVRDALDVNQVFDAISYLKGCSVIRMLANHLTTDVFFRGVSQYLDAHRYGNAKTTALWDALSNVSGQDVNALMANWIGQCGFPVLSVAEGPGGALALTQTRFLSTGDLRPDDDTTVWWVPLAITGRTGRTGAAEGTVDAAALLTKTGVVHTVDDDFYKVNTDATGFYRVNYTPQRLAKLSTQLARLSASDKIMTAGSAAELAFAGNATTPALLSFLEGFDDERHVRVLTQVLDAVGTLQSIFGADAQIGRGLAAFVLKLIAKPLRDYKLELPPSESFTQAEYRKALLTAAVANGHPDITAQALALFDGYMADRASSPVKGDLRTPVFLSAVTADPARAVPLLLGEWKTTTAPDGRDVALLALAGTNDAAITRDVLVPFLFGATADCAAAADVHLLTTGLSKKSASRPALWAAIQQGWDGVVHEKLGGNPILLDRFVGVTLDKFSDAAELAELEAFFAGRNTRGFDRTLGTVLDTVRGRVAYRARDAEDIRQWLVAHGYVS